MRFSIDNASEVGIAPGALLSVFNFLSYISVMTFRGCSGSILLK